MLIFALDRGLCGSHLRDLGEKHIYSRLFMPSTVCGLTSLSNFACSYMHLLIQVAILVSMIKLNESNMAAVCM